MEPKVNRNEGFYKYLVLTGLLLAVVSGGIGSWSIQFGQDRAFALQSDGASLAGNAAILQTAALAAEERLTKLSDRLQSIPNRRTAYHAALASEVSKVQTQVDLLQLEVKSKTDVAAIKSRQFEDLASQRSVELKLTAFLSGLGLALTMTGLVCWYWRVQRYREIEGRANMTATLVEEIVAQSKAEASRGRSEGMAGFGSVDGAASILTETASATAGGRRTAKA